MLSTVVVGLEVLTGICAGVEDAEPEVEEDEVEEDEVEDEDMEDFIGDDDDVLAEAAAHADAMDDIAPRLSSSVTLSLPHLLSLSIPARLASLASLNPLSFPPSSSASIHPPTTAMLSTLHLRALEALNNLLLTIAAAGAGQLQGQLPLQGIWDGLMQLIKIVASEPEVVQERGQEMRGEVVQMAVGCAWGIAKIGADDIVRLYTSWLMSGDCTRKHPAPLIPAYPPPLTITPRTIAPPRASIHPRLAPLRVARRELRHRVHPLLSPHTDHRRIRFNPRQSGPSDVRPNRNSHRPHQCHYRHLRRRDACVRSGL